MVENQAALKKVLKLLKLAHVADSKKISAKDRGVILKNLGVKDHDFRFKEILVLKDVKISYITWEMDHEIIDQENILAASLRAMKEASQRLSTKKKNHTTILIDGHMKLRWGTKTSPWNEIPIIKGDSKSLLIGLASLIAKEKRDIFMRSMHELYPQYGFNSHFGYPTKSHREAIQKHGPCPIHRKTFKGVKEFLRS
jgi:ribonuclease HII